MNKIVISVVIPCYNEEANIKKGVLEEVHGYLSNKNFAWEVVISDDGSTDKSKDFIKDKIKSFKNFILLTNPHGGKPLALKYGVEKASGEYILFSDMDQSTPISELDKMLSFTEKGFEIIIGSRGVARKDFPIYRKIGAYIFSSVRRLMILPEIVDTQCGFKLIRRDVLVNIFPKLEYFRANRKAKGWVVSSWDVEFLHIAKKKGYKIKEVRVLWQDRDASKGKGGGLFRYIRESKDMFYQILKVKLSDIRGIYD